MSRNSGFDIEDLLKLSALSNQEQYAEDDDDEDDSDYAGEDDDDSDYGAEDDDDSYALVEQDDDSDMFGERRRRRGRSWSKRRYRRISGSGRKINQVHGSRSTTLRSPTGQRMRVTFGKSYATTEEVNKLIKDTEVKFAAAMKERKTNFEQLSKQIASASNSLEGKVSKVKKSVSALEKKSQSAALLPLLMGTPKVEKIKFKDAGAISGATEYEADVTFEKPDLLLPLLLSGGFGGGGSSGSDNTLLLALAFSNKK
jgi:hypothetical protein